MPVQFDLRYGEQLNSGTTSNADVPDRFPCSIGGRPYMTNTSFEPYRRDAFRLRSIDPTRTAEEISNIPGETTVNTQGLWWRTAEDWARGAGQAFFDRKDSDAARFRSSKGINPWRKWQIALQPDTTRVRASANTNLKFAVAGAYLYVIDGDTLAYTTDLATWTTVTGTPAGAISDICSDGYDIWTAHGANGLYHTTAGGAAAAAYVTGTVTICAYANGRLMVSDGGQNIWNVTAGGGGAIGAALYTHPSAGFAFVGFCEGNAFIYAAGNLGDKGMVYRLGIEPDGTALAVPVLAMTTTGGETITGIGSYVGYTLVGTSLGVRFTRTASATDPEGNQGDLISGSIVPDPEGGIYNIPAALNGVHCFAGYNRFVYFGWTNYDGTSTGLGRLSLQTFIDPLTPAYASDLMVMGQGTVTSVVIFKGVPLLAVSGLGFYNTSSDLVASGSIDQGYATYGIWDEKIGVEVDVHHTDPVVGSHAAYVNVDDSGWVLVGTHSQGGPEGAMPIPQLRGEFIELRHVLTASGTTGPTIHRATLKAAPGISSGTLISLVLPIYRVVTLYNGEEVRFDPDLEYSYLNGWRQTQQFLSCQVGNIQFTAQIQSLDWLPVSWDDEYHFFNSDVVVYLKVP